MDLEQIERNLRGIDSWEILIPIIQKNLHYIERLNKEQLQKGIRSTGRALPSHSKSPMSEIYVDSKIERGVYDQSIYPAWNLYNTGSFYDQLKAKIEVNFGIIVESSDFKASFLEDEIGSDLYGLTPDSLSQFIDIIIDDFRTALLVAMTK